MGVALKTHCATLFKPGPGFKRWHCNYVNGLSNFGLNCLSVPQFPNCKMGTRVLSHLIGGLFRKHSQTRLKATEKAKEEMNNFLFFLDCAMCLINKAQGHLLKKEEKKGLLCN